VITLGLAAWAPCEICKRDPVPGYRLCDVCAEAIVRAFAAKLRILLEKK
jgi:hypothetical protein